ncbi:unnamed protein product [Pocillopora meandrina]|uniref:Uncharacterized protein n=1 Tax=Pocillopora meandrina TaxID=46732 RepID=A0AAU9WF60_9CNID|nr:unnamed protein product [Pocillopora meandrina]
METFLMVKPDEFRALVDYYKGKITEKPVVKELLMQERKLTEKLRQIPIAGGVEPLPRDDEGNLMEGLQEGLLK